MNGGLCQLKMALVNRNGNWWCRRAIFLQILCQCHPCTAINAWHIEAPPDSAMRQINFYRFFDLKRFHIIFVFTLFALRALLPNSECNILSFSSDVSALPPKHPIWSARKKDSVGRIVENDWISSKISKIKNDTSLSLVHNSMFKMLLYLPCHQFNGHLGSQFVRFRVA